MSYSNWFSFGAFDLRDNTLNADYDFAVSTRSQFDIFPQLYDEYSIEGRSGKLLIPKQKIDNISVSYEVAVSIKPTAQPNTNIDDLMRKLQEQSIAFDGYQILRDYAHYGAFRMARINSIVSIDKIARTGAAAHFRVTFDCRPQLYFDSGNEWTTVNSGDSVNNPHRIDTGRSYLYYTAYPLIRATLPASTAVTIWVADGLIDHPTSYAIHVSADTFGSPTVVEIDTETGHSYNPTTGANYDGDIEIDEFPHDIINPAGDMWKFTLSGISSVSVKPRWWRL